MQSFVVDTSMRSPSGVAAFAAAIAPDGYDATDDRGRRRPARTTTAHEDSHLNERRRRMATATTRDLARNWVLASWAIRKHLDYVSDFTFQAKTSDKGFNKDYELWQAEVSKKERFDVAARHSQRRAVRIAEACKTVEGDVGWMKLAPAAPNAQRGMIQAIEGDRIAMPAGSEPKNGDPKDWINGMRVDPNTGRVLAMGICRRVGATRKELQRIVPARNMIMHANYEFRYDQVRGISPLATALNFFQDTYESFDYAFAKVKLNQLFGLTITSKSSQGAFAAPPSGDDAEEEEESTEPRIDLKRGPFVTELDVDEEAKVIESATPSTQTVEFLKLAILIALRALDIPFSFLDESWTNFFGSRGGLIQYLLACNSKVIDLQDFQNEHHKWRAGLAVADGELVLPSGKDFGFLKHEFVPGGVPWWDATKEVRGAGMAVAIGQTSPQRICRETGTNFFQNIDEIAEAMEYAKSKGVPLTFADSSSFAPEITVQAQEAAK